MQIVSSKVLLTIPFALIKALVAKNNQNSGDQTASTSFISSETVPGIIDKTNTNTNTIIEDPINTDRRHLYLSVTAPMTGLNNNPGKGCNMRNRPTRNAEYPRCFAMVDINGLNGA